MENSSPRYGSSTHCPLNPVRSAIDPVRSETKFFIISTFLESFSVVWNSSVFTSLKPYFHSPLKYMEFVRMTCEPLLNPSFCLISSLILLFVTFDTQLLITYLVSSADSKLTGTMSTSRSCAAWTNELFNLHVEMRFRS